MEEQLADLLAQAGRDHHQAFIEVDGYDPDWPAWYAAYLQPRLAPLGIAITTAELAARLAALDKAHRAEQPGQPWHVFYARRLLEHQR